VTNGQRNEQVPLWSLPVAIFIERITSLWIFIPMESKHYRVTQMIGLIKIYNIPEVAKILKCSERTIRGELFERKRLRYLKVGREVRIREEDLVEFIEQSLKPCIYDMEILP
jgi:excisionase family DNA binding protein